MRFFYICLIILLCASCFSGYARAQEALMEAMKEHGMGEVDLEARAFPPTHKGCTDKMSFFLAVKKDYVDGTEIQDITQTKMFQPLVTKIYDDLRENGTEEATIRNMQNYTDCIKNAKPTDKDKDNKFFQARFKACDAMNAMIMDTLDGIKNRRSKESLLAKYGNGKIDFSYTPMETQDDPAGRIIETLYQASEQASFEETIMLGHSFNMGCYSGR